MTPREAYITRCREEAVALYNALVPLDLEPMEAYLRDHPPSIGAIAFLPFLWEEYVTGERKRQFIKNVQTAGARENKDRAADRRENWRRINRDLLKKKPDLDTLDKRAEYILKSSGFGTMKSGKPHSIRTIKDAIKGTR